jgi:hypothetical protein
MKVTLILDDSYEAYGVEDSSEVNIQLGEGEDDVELTTFTMTGDMITWKQLLKNIKRAAELHYGYKFKKKDCE